MVVSRLGLEPRALALQGLIRLLGLGVMENDGVRENHRATSDVHAIGMMMEYDYRRGGIVNKTVAGNGSRRGAV